MCCRMRPGPGWDTGTRANKNARSLARSLASGRHGPSLPPSLPPSRGGRGTLKRASMIQPRRAPGVRCRCTAPHRRAYTATRGGTAEQPLSHSARRRRGARTQDADQDSALRLTLGSTQAASWRPACMQGVRAGAAPARERARPWGKLRVLVVGDAAPARERARPRAREASAAAMHGRRGCGPRGVGQVLPHSGGGEAWRGVPPTHPQPARTTAV
jgi:hypothetical protein